MRLHLLTKGSCLFFMLCIFTTSCQKYQDFEVIDDIDYSGEMAFPLVFGSATIQDLLDEASENGDLSSLIINPNGTMELAYENSPVSEKISDLYDPLPTFPIIIPDNDSQFEVQLFEDLEIQDMHLKSGTLTFELQSPYTEDIDVLITLPNLTKDGIIFNVTHTIEYNGTAPVEVTIPAIDMTGYTFSLENNMMQLYYQAINSSGSNVQILPIIGMAKNWDYDYIKGSWATDTFEISNDTLQIEIYDDWVAGDVSFEDPRLSLVINNSFGFPTIANIEELRVITASGEPILLESTALDGGVHLAYPNLMEVGQSKETLIELNKENSNIVAVLNSRPQKIIYNVSAIINPDGNSDLSGFMTDESALDLSIHSRIPIHGTATGFEIEEPLESDLEELDNIESVEFKIIINNGMPVEAGIQLYFLDTHGNKIDSLYSDYEYIVKSATMDNNGLVASSTETTSLVTFDAARMERIKESKKMLIGGRFSTANNGNTPIQLLTSHEMGVKVGMKVRLTN